jgi:hypothetical protein
VVARQKLDELASLSNEIDRDPMDRRALERAAAELSARTIELEDAHRAADAASAAADATRNNTAEAASGYASGELGANRDFEVERGNPLVRVRGRF